MATVNIRRDVTDPFYRYKMEKIQAKIEGKGNGIKTVIVNLSSVAQSLARPPAYVLKYFGMELGAQTKENDNDRWIINGAHEANKLQDYLDGFINKFVLCRKCKNPETVINIKDERIILDCKACGEQSEVERGLKFSAKLIQEHGKKGKKDKSSKKADRKARKEAESGVRETSANGHGSPGDSNSEQGDENGDVGIEAGSDDEFTRKIQNDAAKIEDAEPKEIKWSIDTSEEAVKARANLANDLQRGLSLDDDEEADGENVYNTFGSWIIETAKEKGSVDSLDDIEIYVKAKDLGIEKKHKTVQVLAQTLFDTDIVKQVDARASMLKKMITSDRHEKALLGGTERLVGKEHPSLIPQVSVILIKFYQNDLISEEVAQAWGTKASKKYVDLSTSKKVRKSAEKFLEWLATAESESDDDEDDEDDD